MAFCETLSFISLFLLHPILSSPQIEVVRMCVDLVEMAVLRHRRLYKSFLLYIPSQNTLNILKKKKLTHLSITNISFKSIFHTECNLINLNLCDKIFYYMGDAIFVFGIFF